MQFAAGAGIDGFRECRGRPYAPAAKVTTGTGRNSVPVWAWVAIAVTLPVVVGLVAGAWIARSSGALAADQMIRAVQFGAALERDRNRQK